MKKIKNEIYTENSIGKDGVFICALGYETRSSYMLDKIKEKLEKEKILIFYFDDYNNMDKIHNLEADGIKCLEAKYNSNQCVQNQILEFLKTYENDKDKISVHIDYSSMPRNWYYNLPIILSKDNLEVFFWYVVGDYPVDYTAYPTAGIDMYTSIGKPTLRTNSKRLHVFGLSYDSVRTKALISEIDPDAYITCNAYDKKNIERGENVNHLNKQVESKALNELSFYFEDFSFMFSKLCEIANEYSNLGSVIFVPDGPKPLIFAMSLVTLYLNKEGISCLHVYRNEQCKEYVNVKPTDIILGFSI